MELQKLFLVLSTVLQVGDARACNSTVRHVKLDIPAAAPSTAQVVPNNYMAYSIEYADMADFAGNLSNPNTFSYQLLRNLEDASGALPIVRPGGSPQNRAFYVADQKDTFIKTYPPTGGTRLQNFTVGPSWFESFQTWPRVKWMFGLSFERGELGKSQSVKQAIKAVQVLGDDIYGLELGNEIDGFPGIRRDANWTIQDYIKEWHEYSDAVSAALAKEAPWLKQPLFQGCSFLAPEKIGDNTTYWNVQSALKLGMASGGKLKEIADHKYMGSICSDSKEEKPTIAHNLLDHHHTTDFLYRHEYLGNYSYSQGVPYVLGETGTVSCHGAKNVSDTYAAAIWAVDYLLYLSTLKVSRVFFHQGTGFEYSSWMPIANETAKTPRFALPQYYGNLLTATALSNDNQQVAMLKNESSFTVYSIYAAAKEGDCEPRQGASSLTGVVLVNLQPWNTTQAGQRPYIEVELPSSIDYASAKIRRLSGPGADSKTGTTFAGRSVDVNGTLSGVERVESMGINRRVRVMASEAVLVSV